MVGLSGLWLPTLLSAVLAFVASSLIHMASPWHLGPLNIPPGDYMFPRPSSRQEMSSPEFLALWQMSIWYRRAWSTTIKAMIDGAIYALLTAGAFAWLWPR